MSGGSILGSIFNDEAKIKAYRDGLLSAGISEDKISALESQNRSRILGMNETDARRAGLDDGDREKIKELLRKGNEEREQEEREKREQEEREKREQEERERREQEEKEKREREERERREREERERQEMLSKNRETDHGHGR